MPILGIGSDLVDLRRVEKVLKDFPQRFPARLLDPAEQAQLGAVKTHAMRVEFCALRLAAKEACAKALGTGFARGVKLWDIAVDSDPAGAPLLRLSGGALRRATAMVGPGARLSTHLTLTDEPPYAQAFVILEKI